jgi:hypothetical protein
MKLEVSSKHIKLRAILTSVAFVIAVVAFSVGIVRIGHKDPGYHLIEAKVDKDTILLNKEVGFKYWFDGSSNDIKRGINDLTATYSPVISAIYKELDHQNTYEGVVNIATLNRNQRQFLTVAPELYSVLKDAYSLTMEGRGYNMFAGALYSEWKSILILDEPDDFDPANNSDMAARIVAIAEMVSDLSNFSLEFDEAGRAVRFSVSERYENFCREYEIEASALDLNLLKDAYMLETVASGLDFHENGYLYTPEGLVLNMRQTGTLGYDLYTYENGSDTVYASVNLEGRFSGATFTASGMGSYYHYVLSTVGSNASNSTNGSSASSASNASNASNGSNLYRHLYFNSKTGSFSDILMSATVISMDRNLVDDVYQTIILNMFETEAEVTSYATSLEKEGKLVSYIFQSTGN